MCITFFRFFEDSESKETRFIIHFNRDEDITRPTLSLGPSPDNPSAFFGLDLRNKGSWFGFNKKTGVLSFVLNVRQILDPTKKSRGQLVRTICEKESVSEALKFMETTLEHFSEYNAFNLFLVIIPKKEVYHLDPDTKKIVKLEVKETFGISNHSYLKPWPKTSNGAKAYEEICQKNKEAPMEALEEELFSKVMLDEKCFAEENCSGEDFIQRTTCFKMMVYPHPNGGLYGTVSESSLVVGKNGDVLLKERVINDKIENKKEVVFKFKLETPL